MNEMGNNNVTLWFFKERANNGNINSLLISVGEMKFKITHIILLPELESLTETTKPL
jgi:hypothetical protein